MTEAEPKVELTKFKKADLLALPWRGWGEPTYWWDSLLIVPTRKMHDSGYAHIAVIGVEGNAARQVLAYPDDIHFPAQSGISPRMPDYGALRMDAYHPSGVLRLWSGDYEFSISSPTSSVDIDIRRIDREAKRARISADSEARDV